MGEFLSPGVFIEELPSQVQVVAAASTSNLGVVGFTERGPSNKATLVTSFDAFSKLFGGSAFGGFVKESFLPLSVAAFFANGGRRAYVVRVPPADSVAATAQLRSTITDQQIETGDGATTVFTKTATTSLLLDNGGTSPLVPGTLALRWRKAGTPVVGGAMKKRDGTTPLVLIPTQAAYEGRVDPTLLQLGDSALDAVVPGATTLKFSVAAATGGPALSVAIAANGTGTLGSGANTATAKYDHRTGRFSILLTGNFIPAGGDTGAVTSDYTPASASVVTADDGAGNITGAGGASTVVYGTGAYTLTATGNAPHNNARVLATYKIKAWSLTADSAGAWANNLRVKVTGALDSYTVATASYAKFNVQVLLNGTLGFEVKETFEEIDFDTSTDAAYFAPVINQLSDYFTVAEPGSLMNLNDLNSIQRTYVIAGGDNLAGSQIITATLPNMTMVPRTLVVTYTKNDGTTGTIKDNGSGGLTGDIDSTGTNTIDYTVGTLNLKTILPIKGGTLVTAAWATTPAETVHTEDFGDATKSYVLGTDGTFNSTNYGRAQFTAVGLQATYSGLYALDRIEEIMQVVVPDFAGDVTVTGDLLDYAAGRGDLPSGGDRFILLTAPLGSTAQQAVDWFRYDLGRFSKYAAIYWPWIKVADPLSNNRPLLMPPMGHVAGVYARTDATKNVGKAPAGTQDGALRFLLGLETDPSQGERDVVSPNKINSLVSGPSTGLAVWGARTIASESDWRYVNVRRLFMFLEKSVYNATAWVVFENNGPALWARVKAQINGFLNSLFVDGYFAGKTPTDAYFVTVDETNNSQASIDAGQLIIDIGVAPNKPAEFVRFRFQQLTQA